VAAGLGSAGRTPEYYVERDTSGELTDGTLIY
jgi:hypothetical protein